MSVTNHTDRIKVYLIFFLFPMILSESCKKQYGKTTVTEVDELLKENFHFGIGSYWVYSNIHSGQLDSVYLINTTYPEMDDMLGRSCYSCRDVHTNIWKMIKDSMADNPVINYICLASDCILFDFTPDNRYNLYRFRTVKQFDSLQIGSTVYSDVQKRSTTFKIPGQYGPPYDTLTYYIKKKVGIVRKEFITSTGDTAYQYNLLQHKIE